MKIKNYFCSCQEFWSGHVKMEATFTDATNHQKHKHERNLWTVTITFWCRDFISGDILSNAKPEDIHLLRKGSANSSLPWRRRWTTGSSQKVHNVALLVLHIFGFMINTTAYHLGNTSIHFLLLRSSMGSESLWGWSLVWLDWNCSNK